MVWESETCFPRLTRCFPLNRKSVIHPQVESGTLTLGECVLQQSRDDCVESGAEIQKQDPGIGS